jgi:Alginate export
MGGMVPLHKEAATFVTIGARVKQAIGMFDYRAEAGLQLGKGVGPATDNVSKVAYQADLEAGITFAPGTRLAINGAIASGDDGTTETNTAYDELYPTTHKWLGLMDVIGFRTNILSANVKFNTKFTDSLSLAIHGHIFSRLQQPALGYVGDQNLAGYEIDTMLKQDIGKFAYVQGLFGLFIPNSNHYATGTTAQYVEAQAGLKF